MKRPKQTVLGTAALLGALPAMAANAPGPDDLSLATADNAGARKYALYCGGCHGLDGRGEVNADVPSLPPHVGAFLHDPEGRLYLVNVGGVMSAGVSDADTAEILNYMIRRFGAVSRPADAPPFDAQQVGKLRAQPVDAVAVRRRIVKRSNEKRLQLPEGYPWP
jgi:mono/diheme cytochrome c family protein